MYWYWGRLLICLKTVNVSKFFQYLISYLLPCIMLVSIENTDDPPVEVWLIMSNVLETQHVFNSHLYSQCAGLHTAIIDSVNIIFKYPHCLTRLNNMSAFTWLPPWHTGFITGVVIFYASCWLKDSVYIRWPWEPFRMGNYPRLTTISSHTALSFHRDIPT